MRQRDILKYSIKDLKKRGKIDSKVIRPGIFVFPQEKRAANIGEVVKVTGHKAYVYFNSQDHMTSHHKNDVFPVTTEDIKDIERKVVKENIENSLFKSSEDRQNFTFKRLSKLIPKVLDKDRFDIVRLSSGYITVTLHYPEITITNSAGLEHKITDLYLQLVINDETKLQEVRIARTSFSKKDIFKKYGHKAIYIHSHSSHTEIGSWGYGFCFGGNTAIGRTIRDYQEDGIDFKTFTTFLINLEDVIKWESLEGGPYQRIHDIHASSMGRSIPNYFPTEEEIEGIYHRILYKLDQLKKYPALRLLTEEITIDYKELLHELITEAYVDFYNSKHIPNPNPSFAGTLFNYDPQAGTSYLTQQDTTGQFIKHRDGGQSEVKFKGEFIKVKYIPEEEKASSNEDKKYAHISVYKAVVNRLCRDLEAELIKNI